MQLLQSGTARVPLEEEAQHSRAVREQHGLRGQECHPSSHVGHLSEGRLAASSCCFSPVPIEDPFLLPTRAESRQVPPQTRMAPPLLCPATGCGSHGGDATLLRSHLGPNGYEKERERERVVCFDFCVEAGLQSSMSRHVTTYSNKRIGGMSWHSFAAEQLS